MNCWAEEEASDNMSVKKAAKAQAAENKEKSPEGEVVREEQKVDSCRIFFFFFFFNIIF